MYVSARRRGLGQAMQTVIDPATGKAVQIPLTTTVVNIPASGGGAQYFEVTPSGGLNPIFPSGGGQSFTDWLNANQTTVMFGGLGLLVLALVWKAAR